MVNEKTNKMSVLLTLIVPRTLADSLADELMQIESVTGFTQDDVLGFTKRPKAMTTAEQVVGRQQMSRFELFLFTEDIPVILSVLSNHKVGSQIHYSIMPVSQHQHCMVTNIRYEA